MLLNLSCRITILAKSFPTYCFLHKEFDRGNASSLLLQAYCALYHSTGRKKGGGPYLRNVRLDPGKQELCHREEPENTSSQRNAATAGQI